MTEENLQTSSPESNSDLQAAEASLDNALAAIKTGQPKQAPEPIETEDRPEPEEPKEERQTLKLPERPEKKFVETDEPEVQKRINELYRDSKVANERNLLLQDELRKIAESAEQREAYLLSKLQEIEGRNTKQDEESALSDLRRQYNDAIQNLDYEAASKINEKIVDFKTEQKLNTILTEQKRAENNQRQQAKTQKPPVYSDPQDVADANRFQTEKGADGSALRPWLQEGHPQFQDVIDMMAAVSNGFIRKNQRPSLSAVMQKVDSWMGLGTSKGTSQDSAPSPLRHPPVLSSNTTLNAGSLDNQAKISDLERTYAAKLGVDEKLYLKTKRLAVSGPISMDSFRK